jgi:hypothetical protein
MPVIAGHIHKGMEKPMQAGRIQKALTGLAIIAGTVGMMAGPAFASKNTGGFKRSSEGIKQDTNPNTNGVCDTLYTDFANQVNRAQGAYDSGNTAGLNQALDYAKGDLNSAQSAGCDWAARVQVPTYGAPGAVSVAHPVGALR